jgi:hypothetical protein
MGAHSGRGVNGPAKNGAKSLIEVLNVLTVSGRVGMHFMQASAATMQSKELGKQTAKALADEAGPFLGMNGQR